MQQTCFVVLGMARSGTSVITRALEVLGIYLGENLVKANPKWNPKGFYEDTDIVYKIHGEIFKQFNFAPYGIQSMPIGYEKQLELTSIKQNTIAFIKNRFANTLFWGFKDPSTVKLLAFWQEIFSATSINDCYIIALRDPLATAQSYHNLTGIGLETSLLLWLSHLYSALAHSDHKKRIVVSYENILTNPKQELLRLNNFFNISNEIDNNKLTAFTHEFLDENCQHYKSEFENHALAKVVPLCVKLYDLLNRLANDEITFADAKYSKLWQAIQEDYNKMLPFLSYVDKLLQDLHCFRRSLKKIQKSFSWKASAPLRLFETYIRAKRKKNKNRLVKAYG